MARLSRREILKLVAASAAVEAVVPGNLAAHLSGDAASPELRYGLFFDEVNLARMRRLFEAEPRFAEYREALLSFDLEGHRRFITDEVEYNNMYIHISRLGRTAEQIAFRYLLTQEEAIGQLAADTIRTIMKFPHWDFYMEAGQTIGVQRASSSTVAVSLASDWLGDYISDDERSEWIRVMGERGCEACYLGLYGIRHPREVIGWHFDSTSAFFRDRPQHRTDLNRRPEITQDANLRAIPASALVMGAIAHRMENGSTEASERWLEMGAFNIRAFSQIFEDDGSYKEGVGYANYTALHVVQAIELLARHAGLDLRDMINWHGYTRYVLNMLMPTSEDPYEIINFSDNGNAKPGRPTNMERTAVPAWIAKTTGDETAQWLANRRAGVHDPWALMWYDESVGEIAPPARSALWISDLDWVVARTGWMVDDLVVAMRSGGPANHEHADRNSIVVKCFGEQLVTDPYRPPYLFADPAWRMRLTEGHSAILIDGRGHEYHNGVEGTNASRAFARIVDADEGDGYAFWSSNCTQPYRLVDLDVRSVIREVIVLYDVPAVVVVDRVRKFEHPSTVEARFFAYNYDGNGTIYPRTDGFVTTRPGAVMRAHVMARTPVTVEAGALPIPEEHAARHPYAAVTTEASLDIVLATVLSISRPDAPTPAVSISAGGGTGQIQVGGRTVTITKHRTSVG